MLEYSFDYWLDLFKKDPKEFERQRNLILENTVNQWYPYDHEKAHKILAQINAANMRLDRIKNNMERFNQIQVMFWKQVKIFNESLHGNISHNKSVSNSAKVINLSEFNKAKPPC
ncbi:MAG: DUF3135 domain-containing protein [Candidatus Thermoplasmatota archaeon]